MSSALIEGEGCKELFAKEPGGHRWQRVPPTEKRGRTQTSTVTVAVLPLPEAPDGVNESDVEFRYTRSSGNGGQNVNKVETAVVATHTPTGIQVRCETERSQGKNQTIAIKLLAAKIDELQKAKIDSDRNNTRQSQIGSGMRGDKVRTIRVKDGKVKCDVTGTSTSYAAYEKGEIWFA